MKTIKLFFKRLFVLPLVFSITTLDLVVWFVVAENLFSHEVYDALSEWVRK